ncbi:carbohydrate ABC transporter permease [Vallitalea okinawensis]|uniref:carbohydrate ABC transporter permease n=1 Tax=Vallitalea okinawensis TaxID=2078660 RepID=UPI000CFD3E00|nr:carbohydrate ABC transporter permease [Vallitalea okinawensis]
MKAKRLKRILLYFILIGSSILMVIPFVWLVRSSLMTTLQIFKSPIEWIPKPFAWENYTNALKAAPFAKYFLNTSILVINAVIGVTFTASLAGFAFARLPFPGKKILFYILLSTMMLPFTVTMIPLYVTWSDLGLVGSRLPLMVPAWLGGGTALSSGAFSIFLLRQFFSTMPVALEEAAYIDGATPFYVYKKIIVPLSKPALIVVGINTFLGTWNDFLGPILYLKEDQYTLSVGLSTFKNNYYASWDMLMAASTMVILPVIIIFFFAQKYFIEGIALSGMKG